jgi:hypothetical protein
MTSRRPGRGESGPVNSASGSTPHSYSGQDDGRSLDDARARLDARLAETARDHAGRPVADVLAALERDVAAAGVIPTDADLSALAARVSAERPGDDADERA